MKKIEIILNGKAYPCAPTMGAMVRYRDLRGQEVNQIGDSLSEMCAYLYCCVVSACKREGVDFDKDFMDFADSVDADEITRWASAVNESQAQAQKKRAVTKKP